MAKQGVGLQSAIWNNHLKSVILLSLFPVLLGGLVWCICFCIMLLMDTSETPGTAVALTHTNTFMSHYALGVVAAALAWFLAAWWYHQDIVQRMTGAYPLNRLDNKNVYNLLENLCISRGLAVPRLYIIQTTQRNAFASGIGARNATITLTQGLVDNLAPDELEAVIAHEITHIMNRDVELIMVAVVFVGIISLLCELLVRGAFRSSAHSSSRKAGLAIAIAIAVGALGYVLSFLIRFAISRRREYMADAGAVQLTKNPDALIRALQKIEGRSDMDQVDDEFHQMMFDNQLYFLGLFSTHPSIGARIDALRPY